MLCPRCKSYMKTVEWTERMFFSSSTLRKNVCTNSNCRYETKKKQVRYSGLTGVRDFDKR